MEDNIYIVIFCVIILHVVVRTDVYHKCIASTISTAAKTERSSESLVTLYETVRS
jgi:hypothetical protein